MKLCLAIALVVFATAGCKQGIGERCQVDSDCAEGTCSRSEPRTCGGGDNQMQIDATVPIDAPTDAAAIDAPP